MKNLFLLALVAVVVSSCGAVAADLAMISCTSPSKTTVTVSVDNRSYNVKTSVSKTYSTSKKTKKSSKKTSTKTVASKPAAQQPQGNQQPAAQQPQGNQSDRKTTTSRTSSTSRSTTSSTTSSSRRSLTNTDESSSSRTTKTISVEAGEHDVKVTDQQGNEVYNERVDLSSSERKVIELQ